MSCRAQSQNAILSANLCWKSNCFWCTTKQYQNHWLNFRNESDRSSVCRMDIFKVYWMIFILFYCENVTFGVRFGSKLCESVSIVINVAHSCRWAIIRIVIRLRSMLLAFPHPNRFGRAKTLLFLMKSDLMEKFQQENDCCQGEMTRFSSTFLWWWHSLLALSVLILSFLSFCHLETMDNGDLSLGDDLSVRYVIWQLWNLTHLWLKINFSLKRLWEATPPSPP